MSHYVLHHADSFHWLPTQPHLSIQGVCTDPPFGIVEFLPQEMTKLRSGHGGVWRLPPTIGGSKRAPLPRFTTLTIQERERIRTYFYTFGTILLPVLGRVIN